MTERSVDRTAHGPVDTGPDPVAEPGGDQLRQRRKVEHLDAVRALGDPDGGAGFGEIHIVPNCAPELDWDDVDIGTSLCGVRLASPLIINAMTGGAAEAGEVNRRLAAAARRHGLAMAVGSETAALRDARLAKTFTVARSVHPDGVLIANLGMGCSAEQARRAVALIGAQMLQIHFNVGQELFMPEGDRRFRGAMPALSEACSAVDVPVIAKEVGQGVAGPDAVRFVAAGARAVDVGGRGGTNFLAVESWRQGRALAEGWQQWGLPTAVSLCEAVAALGGRADVVASGGIRGGHDLAKAMALGAAAVGMAGPLIRLLADPGGDGAVDELIEGIHWTLRAVLVLTGSRTWDDLRRRPAVIGGRVREWLVTRGRESFVRQRGLDPMR